MSLQKLKKYLPVVLALVLMAVVVMPYLADAKLPITNPSTSLPDYGATAQPKDIIMDIINKILLFAGILAVLFIIIGGFQYIVSGANEEWAESGKKTLKNAIIGLVIIILSYVIVNVINQALSNPPTT